MAYDLLIKNGLIVDARGCRLSGGDVGHQNGKIVEIGKLSGARRARSTPGAVRLPPALSTIIAL